MSNKKQSLNNAQNAEVQELVSKGKIKRTKIDDDIQKILEDAQNNRANQMRTVLDTPEKKKRLLNCVDANHRTPLHFAAYYNSKEVLDYLISENADLNITDFDGYTPLMLAIKVGNKDIIGKLLNCKGTDLNIKSKEGFTALQLSVLSSDKSTAKLILSKDNVVIPTEKSESGSILHAACGIKDMEIIDILVEKESKLLNSLDDNDMTPLHIACAYGNRPLALELIRLGSNVNAVAIGGVTPLHIASDAGDIEICKALADKGAEIKMDSEGATPISLAIAKKNKQLETLLSTCKVDTESYNEASKKKQGKQQFNDKASPETLKKQGNKAYGNGDYELALHWYQLAIDVEDVISEHNTTIKKEPIKHFLYSNKSACHSNMKNFEEALQDAEKCIELAPNFPKGYLRKSTALEGLGKKEEAKIATDKMNELIAQGFN